MYDQGSAAQGLLQFVAKFVARGRGRECRGFEPDAREGGGWQRAAGPDQAVARDDPARGPVQPGFQPGFRLWFQQQDRDLENLGRAALGRTAAHEAEHGQHGAGPQQEAVDSCRDDVLPRAVLDFSYGLTHNGEAILNQVDDGNSSDEIRVIVNWLDELKRKVPN